MATTATATSGNSRRVARLLELQLDDELLQGLQCIDAGSAAVAAGTSSGAAVPGDTHAASIKAIADQQILASYEQLLSALSEADRRYLAVADSVSTLAAEGARARDVLGKCAAASGTLLGKIDGLVAELAEVQQREQRIGAFIRSFQISDADAVTLRHGEVSHEFLAALAKLQRIHDSCKKFAQQSNANGSSNSSGGAGGASVDQQQQLLEQQQAAVEVMESTFLLHMGAMEKLAAFVGNTAPEVCGGSAAVVGAAATSESAADQAALFVDAVRALQSSPGMWAKAVHEIARVRRGALLRRLGSHAAQLVREANARLQQQQQQRQGGAAGRGGNASTAGDGAPTLSVNSSALRLLGDLCAWLDETAAEEKDSASAFFFNSGRSSGSGTAMGQRDASTSSLDGTTSSAAAEGAASSSSSSSATTAAHFTIQDYLDSVFDAVARQLKLRAVETVNEMSEAVWPRMSSHAAMAAAAAAGGGGGAGSSSGGGAGGAGVDGVAAGPLSILSDASRVHAFVALYKTESLFSFYGARVGTVFGASSSVVAALNDARLESMRLFYELLSGVASAVRHVVESTVAGYHRPGADTGGGGGGGVSSSSAAEGDYHPTEGLAPHPSVSAACALLRALLQVIESSPTPQPQRGSEAAPLLSALLDPISRMIESRTPDAASPSSSSPGSANDAAFCVYAINTLCAALSSVLPFDFTQQRQQALTDLLEATVLRYIRIAALRTNERLELDVALQLLSQRPAPTKESAALAMKVFFTAVFAGEGICPLPVPHLEDIQPVRVRERCRKAVVEQVCAVYDRVWDIVSTHIEPDAEMRKLILHHDPAQLRILLE